MRRPSSGSATGLEGGRTLLADYLREVGRPVPGPESQFGSALARNTLVSAVKV